VAAHDHERGPLFLGAGGGEGGPQGVQVVHVVHLLDVPAVGAEAGRLVLRIEGERGRTVDRDPVVVVDVDELAQAEVAGDRCRLGGHPLHQVSVRADGEDAMVDDHVVRTVVALGEEAFGDRHPHPVGEALAERAGRRLHARREVALRMAGRERAPLAEALELLHGQVVAGQVQDGVLEDAGVPGGEHEAVAVRPLRVGGVVAQKLAVDQVGHRSQRHRRARVAGVRLLHRVHGQNADGVDRQLLEIGFAHPFNDTR